MDSEIDDDFRASFEQSGPPKLQSAETTLSANELPPKIVPGGLSRYYCAARLNGLALSDRPGEAPNESPWMPNINGTFWDIYANRLRVYATETEVCYLGA
jgi:hypothetical protein